MGCTDVLFTRACYPDGLGARNLSSMFPNKSDTNQLAQRSDTTGSKRLEILDLETAEITLGRQKIGVDQLAR